MKYIRLKSGERILVDNKDFDALLEHKWHIKKYKDGRYCYAVRKERRTKKTVLMHRQILKTPEGIPVDHINHNTFDNRRKNIRNCFRNENAQNRLPQKCLSGHQGVRKHQNGKWEARIQRNNVNYNLGHFVSKPVACQAYQQAKQSWAEKEKLEI